MLVRMLLAFVLFMTFTLTSPASAETIDQAFLKALSSQGITWTSEEAAIVAGHETCWELDGGFTGSQIAQQVMGQTDLDGYHAGFFVGASIAAYCPWHRGTT